MSVSTLARKDELSGEVEAIASLQLEMTGGVYANVTASARAPYRTLVEVTGVMVSDRGEWLDRGPAGAVGGAKSRELVETVTVENGDGYTRMLDSFARAFRGDERVLRRPAKMASCNMRALDAAYKSWRSGRRETV